MDNRLKLFTAVATNDMETFYDILHKNTVDLNMKHTDGNTLLLMSLEETDSNYTRSLLEAGCDVNIANDFKCTALHKAVSCNVSLEIVHELIKNGADINAQRENGDTPLHDAIYCGNLEIVSMLLYYGADINISCNQNMTPLMWAFVENELEISETLFGYYDDFSSSDTVGNTTLHLAVNHKNPLAVNIVKTGVNVNCLTAEGDFPLLKSLNYDNIELFKLIWSALDFQILLDTETPFLLIYINECCYSTSEWLEGLYLILTSSIANCLIEHCTNYTEFENNQYSLLSSLLCNFIEKHVEFKHRMSVIYLLLSLGAEITASDIYMAHQMYGFNEELEALIYAGSGNYHECIKPAPSYILALENNFHADRIFELFVNQIMATNNLLVIGKDLHETVYSSGFFSLPYNLKQNLLQVSQIRWPNHRMLKRLEKKFHTIPEIPTLVELCRNQVYLLIKHNCRIKKPYQYHEIVKVLNLPQHIKNLIHFKTPIY